MKLLQRIGLFRLAAFNTVLYTVMACIYSGAWWAWLAAAVWAIDTVILWRHR